MAWGLPLQAPPTKITFKERAQQIVESVRVIATVHFGDLEGYLGTTKREVSSICDLIQSDGRQSRLRVTLHDIHDWAWDSLDRLLCPNCIERKLEDDFQFNLNEWRNEVYREYLSRNPREAEHLKRSIGSAWMAAHDEIMTKSLREAENQGNEEEQVAMLDYLEYLEPVSSSDPQSAMLLKQKPLPTPEHPWRCDSCSRATVTTSEELPE